METEDEVRKALEQSMGDCSYNEPFALMVLGDSMAPEFPDRCIIVLERSDVCKDGMYIVAMVEGTRWFRQYRNDERGERLVALNPDYPEIPLEGLDWHVEAICYQRNIQRKIKHYRYD